MSPASDQQFNTWFPAVVVGLVIGLLAAAFWYILRRRTWLFASRFWPGVLKEVGLDHPSLSRTEVEEKLREVTKMLSASSSQISGTSLARKLDFDKEAQRGINPLCTPTLKPITFTATAYLPDGTPKFLIHRVKILFGRHSRGPVKQSKSSIILHAALPVDPLVLSGIGELAKDCFYVDIIDALFSLGTGQSCITMGLNAAGEVHLHVLAEGDVPVNVEARWQEDGTGITMCGLYLNGAQVKVATQRTSTTLRSAGPAAQGREDLDELHFPTEGLDIPGDDPLIYAAKVVEADGISLIVRSEASTILHPCGKSLGEVAWGLLQRISLSAKKMIISLLKVGDQQPENTSSGPDLEFDLAHFELLAEHWKGVSEIEFLENRRGVVYYLQEVPAFGIVEYVGPQTSRFSSLFIRDQYYLEYWQRGLQDLNKVILFSNSPRKMNGSQFGTYISTRGGIKFLLGDFEGSLEDFDLAYNLNTEGHRSSVLLDRALAKYMLGRYPKAMQDILAVIAINPNLIDIQELQTCVQQILYQLSFPLRQRPQLSEQHNSVPKIPDLLTGDEW